MWHQRSSSKDVVRNQVTFQEIILIERISLLPQVQEQQNYAAAIPVQADYFDERGIYKEYRPPVVQHPAMQHGNMNILKKVHNPSNAILISEDGVEIQNNTSTSTSDPAPISVPSPDFPFTEFLSTEVVIQSQIDSSKHFRYVASERRTTILRAKPPTDTDTPLQIHAKLLLL